MRVVTADDGASWRVTFGVPPGNILDIRTLGALSEMFRTAGRDRAVKAICLEGAGSHFSYGASVEEHLPDRVAAMLAAVRGLAVDLVASAVVVVAAVRGRCLGGGLEVASLCHRVVAAPAASLGQPEIALGVFAPVASIVLPERVGRGRAEELLLTGRVVSSAEARTIGLVDETADDPADAALAWIRRHLIGRSASSLRFAVRAARAALADRLHRELPALEALYLDGLMTTGDAVEGLKAFLEKRQPHWRHS